MDPSAAARCSAERWMGVAEKLLMARDLEGCKQFASQALADDPRAPGADDLVAAADALLAAQRRRLPTGVPDPYAVLGLDSALPASRDPDVVHSHYRRLSFILNRSHPDRPCSLAFADAARLVAEAWAFLSDPLRKASLDSNLDAAADAAAAAKAAAACAPTPSPEKQRLQPQPPLPPHAPQPAPTPSGASPPSKRGRPQRTVKAAAACAPTPSPEKQWLQPQPPLPPQAPQPASTPPGASPSPPSKSGRPPRAAKPRPSPGKQQEAEVPRAPTFWTACPSCCHVHQYDRSYEASTLLCPSCRRPFFSAEMTTPPPIVPGTDMYYCSWGFFPMGFPGGPAFSGPVNSPTKQAPSALGFYPMGPYLPLPGQGDVRGSVAGKAGSGTAAVSATLTAPVPAAPSPVNSTHVKVGARKRGRPKGSKNKNAVIEIK